MIESLFAQAVFDESGDPGFAPGSSRHLVVAGVACEDLRQLRRLIVRLRRTLDKRLRQHAEIKAALLAPTIVRRAMHELAELNVEIYVVVMDKRDLSAQTPRDDLLGTAYTACIRQVLARHPDAEIMVDQPYTRQVQRERFTHAIQAALQRAESLEAPVPILLADSMQERALQIADMVAWSFYQRHAHGDASFCELLQQRLISEVRLTGKENAGLA
jgi:hypothetical protein